MNLININRELSFKYIYKIYILIFQIIYLSLLYPFLINKKIGKTFYEKKSFSNTNKNNLESKIGYFEIDNVQPENYERQILDQIKHRLKGNLLNPIHELYFINGLIRKYRPTKILEIGVCSGGVSATILNAIKDIDEAKLYSCDLEKKHYTNNDFNVGYVARDNFPELLGRWKLYTGNTTAAFIEEIGGNIDFVFIDTAHVMPGEVLNVIEILPFLKENAIIAFDDINYHMEIEKATKKYFHSCNNLLFSVLRGKKIIYNQKNNVTFYNSKLGAIILDSNQQNNFFEYFYLLSNNWSYMPNKFEIDKIRELIKKYYKPFFLSIFDKAVETNYRILKKQGLLKMDYILYTFKSKRKKPIYS